MHSRVKYNSMHYTPRNYMLGDWLGSRAHRKAVNWRKTMSMLGIELVFHDHPSHSLTTMLSGLYKIP
jgi:hypothetical protein